MHIPPGGWKYVQPETETEIRGGDYYSLIEKVRRHRHLNYLDTREIEDQVQAQICEGMSTDARAIYCRDSAVHPNLEPHASIAFDDVKHFLKTIRNTRRFVAQSEADRRSEICASCPRNTAIAGCSACRNLIGLVFNVIGNRHTPLDARLRACGVCGCELKTAVHLPLEAFPKVAGHEYPPWCWRS